MSAADEIHVVLSNDATDAEVMRYRLPSSTEQLVAAGEHDCDGDGVLVLVHDDAALCAENYLELG
jgi:hypothetical protein